MLSPLRQCARRAVPTLTRSLSAAPAVTNIVASTSSSALTSSSPHFPEAAPSAPVFARPEQTQLLDIPPAEDPLLHYLASCIQRHGKRKRANRTVSSMLLHLHTFTRQPPLELFRTAVLAAAPAVRCMHHTYGPKTIVRPVALSEKQRTHYAIEWILDASDNRSGQTLAERIAREVVYIISGEESNTVLLKKKQTNEFAMVNRCVDPHARFDLPLMESYLKGERGIEDINVVLYHFTFK